MLRIAAPLLMLAFFTPAIAGTPLADGFKKLTGPQIKKAFTGHQFSDEVHFRLYYKANGEINGVEMGKKITRKWRINNDQLCSGEGIKENCLFVWKKGSDVRLVIDDSDISTDGKLQ